MLETRSLLTSRLDERFEALFSSLDDRFASNKAEGEYLKYQTDPVAFGEQLLGETYTDEVKAMMESVRDNMVTVAKSPNAAGKSHGAARVAIWWYKCHVNAKVYMAAAPPIDNLQNILWGEIESVIRKHRQLFATDYVTRLSVRSKPPIQGAAPDTEEDEDDDVNLIKGLTIPMSGSSHEREARFSGKHAPYLLFLLDEADAIPDEVLKGIESCMSGGVARLLCMFNPRAEIGAIYRMERDGRANIVQLSAFNHPNVREGRDIIPGAVTRETTVRRINEWCRPLAKNESKEGDVFELPSFLVGAIAKSQSGREYPPLPAGFYKIMEPAFSYMVLGRYPSQGTSQLISREWIARARARFDAYVAEFGEIPPFGVTAIMGQDVAEFGDDANVAVFRYGGYVERPVIWGGMDILSTGDRAVSEYQARKVQRVNVDATGVGAGVAPHMSRKGCVALPIKVASKPTEKTELGEFKILRDQLWWSCREWLRVDPGAMLPPDEMLLEELATPTYEIRNGKIMVMQKDVMKELLKRSPDRADSLCLTFFSQLLFGEYDLS